MELVGNVIQAIAEYFHITTISTIANFPAQMKSLNELTEKVALNFNRYTSSPLNLAKQII